MNIKRQKPSDDDEERNDPPVTSRAGVTVYVADERSQTIEKQSDLLGTPSLRPY